MESIDGEYGEVVQNPSEQHGAMMMKPHAMVLCAASVRRPSRGARIAMLALLALLALVQAAPTMAARAEDFRLRNFEIGGQFTLTDQHARKLSLSDLRGSIVFLMFGFTQCPDVCPTTLAVLTGALRELRDDGSDLRIVLISVDPERDTPPILRKYVANFHPSIVGLTGTVEQVTRVSDLFSAKFRRTVPTADSAYSVAHTTFVYLLNRQGKVRYVFPAEIGRDVLVEAAGNLIRDESL